MQFSSVPVALFVLHFSPENYTNNMIYWSLFSFIAALLVTLWLLRPDMREPAHREASSAGEVIVWSILGVFLAFFAQGLAASIETYILGIDPGSENTMAIMDIVRTNLLFMLVPAIIAPILEEIIFRKIVFGSLYKRMNFFLAALLSALIFAAVHMDFEHLLIYTAMGFTFAFLYVRTKRILVPIIVHAGMNTLVVLAQYSLTPEQIQEMLEETEQMQMIFMNLF
jgi:hypothetical protein